MAASPTRSLLRSWALALAASVVLAAAGERWPLPLSPDGAVVWALLLLPTLALAGLLLARWSLADPQPSGDSTGAGQE